MGYKKEKMQLIFPTIGAYFFNFYGKLVLKLWNNIISQIKV
jgi:hypothetical protein